MHPAQHGKVPAQAERLMVPSLMSTACQPLQHRPAQQQALHTHPKVISQWPAQTMPTAATVAAALWPNKDEHLQRKRQPAGLYINKSKLQRQARCVKHKQHNQQ